MKPLRLILALALCVPYLAAADTMDVTVSITQVDCRSIFEHRETQRVSSKVTRWFRNREGVRELTLSVSLPGAAREKYVLRKALLDVDHSDSSSAGTSLLLKASSGKKKIEISIDDVSSELSPATIKVNGVPQDFLNFQCSAILAG